jgi:regulator of sigma E protease
MLDLLQKAAAFVFVLGVLIAFHEFGHFWVARKLGVKVLRFSVGFGKPLLRYQANADSPEYVLAALPLGGYVKMLDEREAEVKPEELHLAFNRQNVWKRIAIVAAGPMFNLVLAIIFFAGVFMVGIPSLKPVVASPAVKTVAFMAGLQDKDIVTAVNGQRVDTWSALRLALVAEAVDGGELQLSITGADNDFRELRLDLGKESLLKEEGDALKRIGLSVWQPAFPAILGTISEGLPAQLAGLRSGDEITSFDGVNVNDWAHLVELIRARPSKKILLNYRSENNTSMKATELTLAKVKAGSGEYIGRLGAGPLIEGDPYEEYRTVTEYGFLDAVIAGTAKTWNMSVLTLKVMFKLVTGQASLKNISGPLSIAQYAGETAQTGLIYLIHFMAVISVSLGVLNLLPIPILDGGHLLFYVVELVKGSAVSERVMLIGQQLGIVLLGLMMCVAFYNDLTRIFA